MGDGWKTTGRYAVLLVVIVVLVLASSCGGPAGENTVTLKASPGSTDVPIYKRDMLDDDVIARLPPGTRCLRLGAPKLREAGLGSTVELYRVKCKGTIGLVPRESLIFASEETPSP